MPVRRFSKMSWDVQRCLAAPLEINRRHSLFQIKRKKNWLIHSSLPGLPPIECTTHITGRLPTPALRSLRLISSLRYIKDRLGEHKNYENHKPVEKRVRGVLCVAKITHRFLCGHFRAGGETINFDAVHFHANASQVISSSSLSRSQIAFPWICFFSHLLSTTLSATIFSYFSRLRGSAVDVNIYRAATWRVDHTSGSCWYHQGSYAF